MSDAWSRAWRCVLRKPRRSVLMILLMTVVFTALVAQSGVRSTMRDVKDAINANVGAGFTARSVSTLDGTQAQRLATLPQISRYSLDAETLAKPKGATPVMGTTKVQLDPRFGGDVGVTGATDSELHPAFQGKLYRIIKGHHVGSGENEALIHQRFAQQNALDVGSTLTLTQGKATVTVSVVGIFDGKTENPSGLPSGASENHVLTDLASTQQLGAQLTVGRYMTERADQLPAALQAAEKAAPDLALEDNSAQFGPVLQAIAGVDRLLTMLLVALCVSGGCILILVSTFWIRGRIRELGVLLAVGKSKANIMAQFALESGIFALTAAVIATVAGQLLSGHFARIALSTTGDETIAGLNPAHGVWDIAVSLGLGLLVIFAGVSLGIIPIIRQRPRRILSKSS